MALIPTSTLDVFTTTSTIFASSVVAAFDAAYDQTNGNLEKVNLASDLTISPSSITLVGSEAGITATDVNEIYNGVALRGWNTVHFNGFGSEGFSIHAGTIEVDGGYCLVNSKISLGVTQSAVLFNTTDSSKGFYGLAVTQQLVLTASDFLFIEMVDTSTFNFDVERNGWYTSGSAVVRRLVTMVRYNRTNAPLTCFDDEYPQRPSIGHRYSLTAVERTAMGFTGFTSVISIFDMDVKKYYYECVGTVGATAVTTTYFAGDLSLNLGAGFGGCALGLSLANNLFVADSVVMELTGTTTESMAKSGNIATRRSDNVRVLYPSFNDDTFSAKTTASDSALQKLTVVLKTNPIFSRRFSE